jgi:hypothetical protein
MLINISKALKIDAKGYIFVSLPNVMFSLQNEKFSIYIDQFKNKLNALFKKKNIKRHPYPRHFVKKNILTSFDSLSNSIRST